MAFGIAHAQKLDGLWRRGGKISVDFNVFVLLYNIKFMNKYKFDIF